MRYYQELLIVLLLFGVGLLSQHRLAHLPAYLGMLAVLGGARLLMPAEWFTGLLKGAWWACLAVIVTGMLAELAL